MCQISVAHYKLCPASHNTSSTQWTCEVPIYCPNLKLEHTYLNTYCIRCMELIADNANKEGLWDGLGTEHHAGSTSDSEIEKVNESHEAVVKISKHRKMINQVKNALCKMWKG